MDHNPDSNANKNTLKWVAIGLGAAVAAMAIFAGTRVGVGGVLIRGLVVTKDMASWAGRVLSDPNSTEAMKSVAAYILSQVPR